MSIWLRCWNGCWFHVGVVIGSGVDASEGSGVGMGIRLRVQVLEWLSALVSVQALAEV